MLYFLTFISLFFTASLAASPLSLRGKEDFVKNHPLAKFHTQLPSSSSKGSIIKKSEQGSQFVLVNSFASKDCGNSDGTQLFESLAMLTGYCMTVSDTSQRWTCDSSTVRIEEFDGIDCDESRRTVDSHVNVGQCFPSNTTDTALYSAVSYDCSSSYAPKGSWFTTMYFSENSCQNAFQGVSMLNDYCVHVDRTTSFKYDYPVEYYYFKSSDCTGQAFTYDISSSMNSCIPITSSGSSVNSMEYIFTKN